MTKNKAYVKGRKKEYKILNEAKAQGMLAARNAGSHGCWDVTVLDVKNRKVHLIQAKPENFAGKDKLMAQWGYISGIYDVTYEVL